MTNTGPIAIDILPLFDYYDGAPPANSELPYLRAGGQEAGVWIEWATLVDRI